MKEKIKYWQAGWENEVQEATLTLEGEDDCPGCAVRFPVPTGVEGAFDPIVLYIEREGGKVEVFRLDISHVGIGLSVRVCRRATEADIKAARDRAREAMEGKRVHWIGPEKVVGGVS